MQIKEVIIMTVS